MAQTPYNMDRFAFGENWKDFSQRIGQQDYEKAKASVQRLVPDLLGKTFLVVRQNPFNRDRGMHYYTDIVDWVGGYPYEYASIQEVTDFFQARGFVLVRAIPTTGFTGCNEFVFAKDERQATDLICVES